MPTRKSGKRQVKQIIHRPVIGPLTLGVWAEGGTYNGMIKEFNLWAEAESLVKLHEELSEMIGSYLVSHTVSIASGKKKIPITRKPNREMWAMAKDFSLVNVEATFVFKTEADIIPVFRKRPPRRLDRERIRKLLSHGQVKEAHLVSALTEEI